MILVDTSVWITHLRHSSAELSALLGVNEVLCHPWIVGEIAMGQLSNRDQVLALLRELPRTTTASEGELARFLEEKRVYGRGIGLIDAHLLISTLLTPTALIWTRDKRLAALAEELQIAYTPA